MQYKITRNFETFEPIKVEFTIESKEDFLNLLIRLNPLLFEGQGYHSIQKTNGSLSDVWHELDDIAAELGMTSND